MDESRERFITDNTGLVHACCRRFTGKGIEYDDLYQNGCIGLVKAAKAFDFDRGVCFSTYAVPVILGEIKRLFRDGGAVKVSRSLKELSYKAARCRGELEKSLGREPRISELACALGVTNEEISEALCAAAPVKSLCVETESGEDERPVAAEDNIVELTDHIALKEALRMLEPNDRRIIECRYYKNKTQSETADILSMTQVQISRRERVIFKELRRMLV